MFEYCAAIVVFRIIWLGMEACFIQPQDLEEMAFTCSPLLLLWLVGSALSRLDDGNGGEASLEARKSHASAFES